MSKSSSAGDRLKSLPIVTGILTRLSNELSAQLSYHSAAHTADVINEALLLAERDLLPQAEVTLLVIAAAFHDAGFLEKDSENEEIGAAWAEQAMRSVGSYSEQDRSRVRGMILDTRPRRVGEGFRQVPSEPLSGYLLDADVANLGREDFFEKIDLLQKELREKDRRAFLQRVFDFVSAHEWYTPAAQALRTKKKTENLKALRKLLLTP